MAQYDITPEEFVTKQIEANRLISVDKKTVQGIMVDLFQTEVRVSRESLQQILGWDFMQECDKWVAHKLGKKT